MSQVRDGHCSNTFTLWLLHTVTMAGRARLVFEEWSLHHHVSQRLSVLEIKKMRGSEITSAEYKHQVLAIGLTSGAVRLYQPDSQVGLSLSHSESCWLFIATLLHYIEGRVFCSVFMAESKAEMTGVIRVCEVTSVSQ